MARQVTCVCGRSFHIGHGEAEVQCRKCGRFWSGEELGVFDMAATILLGGEIARADHKKGDRKTSPQNPHTNKQTNRQRPQSDPLGSAIRWFFG